MDPNIAKKILIKLTKTTPGNQKYNLSINATAVDQAGEKVNLTMYAKTWEEVEIGQTYICHHLQIDLFKNKGVNQLRTLLITAFMKTLVF